MQGVELAFEGLTRSFGPVAVLTGVDGLVRQGEVLLVSGPNGSGKSTLLRCLAGLVRPQAGSIRLHENGRDLDTAARRLRVGYVAPDLALYEALTARENLELFCRLRGVPAARGAALLARLDLPPERPAGALSSGMRQKLRWAWALLHEPRVLLLDEPFQNLDAAGEEAVRALLDRHLETGLAVVATPSELRLPRVDERLELAARGGASGRAA